MYPLAPKHILESLLGSQNMHINALLGARKHAKVPLWEPKCMPNVPFGAKTHFTDLSWEPKHIYPILLKWNHANKYPILIQKACQSACSEPKHIPQSLLGNQNMFTTHFWKPKHANKCPLGSQNAPKSALYGAQIITLQCILRSKNTGLNSLWESKHILKSLLGN